ncbi:hypothetical protein [Spiroplasma endosymbiont of Danaus chrysippus]|uniref:hypothetical protein n=1 Tax=Spiroplasma endosymbiont of Danaus chrysippus TaxID=2691041 RepID=UPI0013C99B34|nr:hypothetical protein [Spiroplasma endosymbiont of Danaus chrysippus]CAB1054133.1 hypothetical protein [Spiroplasma endosymbiont of Danaus chrysippus]
MPIEKKEIIFNDYINNFININELKKKINEELKTLEKKFKKQKEIKENITKILFNLKNNAVEIKENLRSLNVIYNKIENFYKNPIEKIECENKNLIFRNRWYINKNIKEINEIISKNNRYITFLNSKKISKWKNNLLIIFTFGFYNKNKNLIKKIEKYKNKKIEFENILLNLKNKKNNNQNIIKNNVTTLKIVKQEFDLVTKSLNSCVFYFTEIQKNQIQNVSNPIDMIKNINSFQEQISAGKYKIPRMVK